MQGNYISDVADNLESAGGDRFEPDRSSTVKVGLQRAGRRVWDSCRVRCADGIFRSPIRANPPSIKLSTNALNFGLRLGFIEWWQWG